MCTEGAALKNPSCMGYFTATEDMLLTIGPKALSICVPTDTAGLVVAKGALDFLEAHPEGLDGSASAMLLAYFASAYPCR